MYNNNQYPQNNNQGPQNQQQGWPGVSGFKIKPNSNGKGGAVAIFTVNARPSRQAKRPFMLFQEFMAAMEAAFNQSGGNGVRIIIPFKQENNPQTGEVEFKGASINIVPNNPSTSFNQGGGGRRQYPTQNQGYGYQPQPQQQFAPAAQRPVAPQPQGHVQQGTMQYGTTTPTTQAPTHQAGNGQPAPMNAYPSNEGDEVIPF